MRGGREREREKEREREEYNMCVCTESKTVHTHLQAKVKLAGSNKIMVSHIFTQPHHMAVASIVNNGVTKNPQMAY